MIRSEGDEAYVLNRARVTMKLFYDPDMSEFDRAEMLEEFGRALKSFPKWAVAQAFDKWNRENRRRPSPGDIVDNARKAVRAVTDELAERRRVQTYVAIEPPRPETKEEMAQKAQNIITDAGFTAKRHEMLKKMPDARTMEEAMIEAKPRAHWTELVDPDGPEMAALKRSRMANPLMRASMGLPPLEDGQ